MEIGPHIALITNKLQIVLFLGRDFPNPGILQEGYRYNKLLINELPVGTPIE